jgi:hypothetical protein
VRTRLRPTAPRSPPNSPAARPGPARPPSEPLSRQGIENTTSARRSSARDGARAAAPAGRGRAPATCFSPAIPLPRWEALVLEVTRFRCGRPCPKLPRRARPAARPPNCGGRATPGAPAAALGATFMLRVPPCARPPAGPAPLIERAPRGAAPRSADRWRPARPGAWPAQPRPRAARTVLSRAPASPGWPPIPAFVSRPSRAPRPRVAPARRARRGKTLLPVTPRSPALCARAPRSGHLWSACRGGARAGGRGGRRPRAGGLHLNPTDFKVAPWAPSAPPPCPARARRRRAGRPREARAAGRARVAARRPPVCASGSKQEPTPPP